MTVLEIQYVFPEMYTKSIQCRTEDSIMEMLARKETKFKLTPDNVGQLMIRSWCFTYKYYMYIHLICACLLASFGVIPRCHLLVEIEHHTNHSSALCHLLGLAQHYRTHSRVLCHLPVENEHYRTHSTALEAKRNSEIRHSAVNAARFKSWLGRLEFIWIGYS